MTDHIIFQEIIQETSSVDSYSSLSETRAIELNTKHVISPLPLQREMPPAKPFPFDAMGDVLGKAAKRIFEIIQAPDAICANSVLAAASLAAQPHVDVEIDGRKIPLSLFLISVAESGERKTAADNVALYPIQEYQKMLVSVYKTENQKYKNQKDAWNKKRQQILHGNEKDIEKVLNGMDEEPTPPLKPIILMEEPTYEGLVKLLSEGQPSVGMFSDEGGRMFGGHGMNPDNLLKTACGLSSLWDGKPITRVRSGDDSTILYGKRFSTHLMIQEVVLEKISNNLLLSGQGLLARCLIVFPMAMAGKRKYQEFNPFLDADIRKFHQKITEILDHPYILPNAESKNVLNPRTLQLHSSAKSKWKRFNESIEKELSSSGRYFPIRRLANKAADYALRIAGILTLIESLDAECILQHSINQSIVIMNYYLDEALRIHSVAVRDQELCLAEQVLEWMQKKAKEINTDLFPLQMIYQEGPGSVRTAKTARLVMKILQQHDAVTLVGAMSIQGVMKKEVWSLCSC